ncbi:PqqD family protein [Kroppenstedtia sanguinis]
MFLKKKKRSNLLKMKPLLKDRYTLEPLKSDSEAGVFRCRLLIPRDSWLERLSVRWLKQPQTIKVKLDPLGSFVLSRCDGDQTVEEIAQGLTDTFGEEAEPVLPRLVKYLQIAEANGWVWMKTES